MKKKYSFVVISFFRVTNPYSGASEVTLNFFNSLPTKDKKLFQFSEIKQNIKNVKTIKVDSKFDKFFKLRKLVNLTFNYCKKKQNPIIIIEGASWVGYSFLFYKFIKKKLTSAKFIYHSHNIEYLLRKQKNNFIISSLTKYFENYICNEFDLFTSVSEIDKKKIKKIYNVNSKILPNGIKIPSVNNIEEKKFKFKYIFFCGSIDYMPNKQALDILVNKIMPMVNKIDPNINLIVSGNKYIPFKSKNLINVGFLSKYKFYRFLKGASIFVNPMKTAFGSQVKMINALIFGKTIIGSKKSISGLHINKKFKNLYITNNNQFFAKLILNKINSKKYNFKISEFYQKKYSIKKITLSFLYRNLI